MNDTVETKKIENYLIKIFQDDTPDDPRGDDNLGKMVCFNRNYNLGDKHEYEQDNYSNWNELEADIMKREKPCVIVPLWIYDHSGISISTARICQWDSSMVGFAFITTEAFKKEHGYKRLTAKRIRQAEKFLKGEIETYNQYLTGDVYGYEIVEVSKCDQDHEHEKFMDSCWGFYGMEYCLKEAEAVVGHFIGKKEPDPTDKVPAVPTEA
jgi:hypothetical protein